MISINKRLDSHILLVYKQSDLHNTPTHKFSSANYYHFQLKYTNLDWMQPLMNQIIIPDKSKTLWTNLFLHPSSIQIHTNTDQTKSLNNKTQKITTRPATPFGKVIWGTYWHTQQTSLINLWVISALSLPLSWDKYYLWSHIHVLEKWIKIMHSQTDWISNPKRDSLSIL